METVDEIVRIVANERNVKPEEIRPYMDEYIKDLQAEAKKKGLYIPYESAAKAYLIGEVQ